MMDATFTAPPVAHTPLDDSPVAEVLVANMPIVGSTPAADSLLIKEVRVALNKSHGLSPRHVKVAAEGNNVRLEGTVGSFYQKQMAQELVRRIDGVESVESQLQVSWR